jgi:uncharacterized protein YodC (DUF2158 family)
MEFKVGDVVRLKSGGPAMTIASIDREGPVRCYCVWFVVQANGLPDGKPETGSFAADTLTK